MLTVLPEWKSLFVKHGKFGEQFDGWFNDRFLGRDTMVRLHKDLDYALTGDYYITPNGCANKKTKWVGNCYDKYRLFTDAELKLASENVAKLQNFARKNNMKVYIVIAPSLGSVYGKDLVPWYTNDNEQEQIQQMRDYIRQKNGLDIVYPYDKIMAESESTPMFFKTDTHWTDSAAFIAYQDVMRQIKRDFPAIHVNSSDDFDYFYSNLVKVMQLQGFHSGNTYKTVGLNDDSFFNTSYKYFRHRHIDRMKETTDRHDSEYYTKRWFTYDLGKYNLTIFGDSFTENMEPIIPFSFKNTFKLYTWTVKDGLKSQNLNIKRFEPDIIKNKTDVMVIVFSKIERLMYIY